MKLARVFDGVRDGVPYFLPDHPRGADPALAAYLRAGAPILVTRTMEQDRLDPGRGAVVPTTFRTDGVWVWTDAVVYYLETHGIRPDPGLRAHAAARGYRMPEVGEEIARRMLEGLPAAPGFTLAVDAAERPVTVETDTGTLSVAAGLSEDELAVLARLMRLDG
ncbi:hypothetical protein [Nonomuraea typhae]|uniref:hypothetical protein n=1 Tax=Nonomuraea typhae TaxID=2603600 RepID=UPI0012F72EC9|nr:hypothetical protein [Nonomuraea typhae]